jgi:hypothetical protein
VDPVVADPVDPAVAGQEDPAVLALAGQEDPAVLAPVVQADLMDPVDVDLMDPVVALVARVMTEVLVANAALVARMEDAAPVGLPIRRGSSSMRWSSMRTEMAC